MSNTLLLDTHIALWLESGDERLRPSTRDLIDDCWLGGGDISVSAVTAWEIASLVDADRIALDLPARQWFDRFVGRPGVAAIPLTWQAACGAYDLAPLEHRDPADRMLIATAIDLACRFVTYDIRITAFCAAHGSRLGLEVAA